MDISTAHKGKPHISAEMWAELIEELQEMNPM